MNYTIQSNSAIYNISNIIDKLEKSIYSTKNNTLIIDNMYFTEDYDKIYFISEYIEKAISYIDVIEYYTLTINEEIDYNQITEVYKLEEMFYSITLKLQLI